jgi:hypothetical protein
MLIILRLAVLPHKHPHELLDSVVKERVVKSFVSTEARILQQPHLASSCFSKFFPRKVLATQPLASPTNIQLLVSGRRILQRFKPLSTTSSTAADLPDRSHQQDQTTTLPARRILHSFRCFAISLLKLTYCFRISFPRDLRRKRCAL